MPIIGIAPCSKLPDYEEAVRRAGGEPRVLDPAVDSPAAITGSLDGLLLAGGGDVLPSLYGAVAHSSFSAAESGRDEYELELIRRASEANLPLFAICRGIQVLNVARGGTLIQDIASETSAAVEHMVKEPRFAIAHDVWMASGSLLETLMRDRIAEGEDLPVNSRHHQAPAVAGDGLVVTGTAPDGVIEALEDPSRRFCLGVQWHPENFWRTGEFRALFEGFVNAARKS